MSSATAVAKSVGEARPSGVAKYSVTTFSDTIVAKSVVEALPPSIAKHSATTAAEAVAPTVSMTVVEAGPPGMQKYSAQLLKLSTQQSRRCFWPETGGTLKRNEEGKSLLQKVRLLLQQVNPLIRTRWLAVLLQAGD